MNILELQNISKHYHLVTAVDDVDLTIPKGKIFGLLGPNGAGKTSIIRMITQITTPDAGSIRFDGEPLQDHHMHSIGYMPEERGLYKKMKVGEQLLYLANLRNMPTETAKQAIYRWFDRLKIDNWWDKKIQELSKGMQQKIQFIATLIHQPKLIILDEPFSGLDPLNANMIRDEIHRLVQEESMSVIFSTHRMEQVEEICDQIALIHQGKKILEGSVTDIKQQFKKNQYYLEWAQQTPTSIFSMENVHVLSDRAVELQNYSESDAQHILATSINEGARLVRFEEKLPSLNDIFIQLVTQSNITTHG